MKNKLIITICFCLIFTTTTFVSCKQERVTKPQNTETGKGKTFVVNKSNDLMLIGAMSSSGPTLTFNVEAFKDSLKTNDLFNTVEVVQVDYGIENGHEEAYLTIIGTYNNATVAFQSILEIENEKFYINTNKSQTANKTKHTCAGSPCSSCSFVRGGFLNLKIIGCKCSADPQNGVCNHTKETEITWIDTVVTVLIGIL
ncbi:MAG: hypothetical protein ACK4HE_06470 [Chitinophagaceae bacterium]|jgi:hypothetical protein|nr:hypothetical protein [Chitinophagaceae bacterium]HAN40025.1 hypothetical protein [Chitinophagaceae bacterium]